MLDIEIFHQTFDFRQHTPISNTKYWYSHINPLISKEADIRLFRKINMTLNHRVK